MAGIRSRVLRRRAVVVATVEREMENGVKYKNELDSGENNMETLIKFSFF